MKNLITRVLYIALLGAILFIVFLFSGSIKGAFYRTFFTPEILKEKVFEDVSDSRFPNADKQVFYEKYVQKEGYYGLKQNRTSIEGDPIVLYIYTNHGDATLIVDYTRDSYGVRKFVKEKIERVELVGRDEDGNFHELDSLANSSQKVILRIETISGKISYI